MLKSVWCIHKVITEIMSDDKAGKVVGERF